MRQPDTHVYITGRRKETLDKAAEQIGGNVTPVQSDSANLADLDRLYATVADAGHTGSTSCSPTPAAASSLPSTR